MTTDTILTDEQCNEFRRFNGSFNDMVRHIYQAATLAERERMEKHCAEFSQDAYNSWRADGNPYDDGQCDAANALSDKIRSGE